MFSGLKNRSDGKVKKPTDRERKRPKVNLDEIKESSQEKRQEFDHAESIIELKRPISMRDARSSERKEIRFGENSS